MKNIGLETMYKELVEHMNEAVWMGDEKERTVYANPKFCELMEYTLEEMKGKESYEFWDEESAKRVRDVNRTKRKKGESSGYEGNLKSKSGKIIPVLLSGTSLVGGGTIGIMTDLRKLREKEEAEKTLGRAVEYASSAIVIIDTEGKVISWNNGAKVIFGYKKQEILGHSLKELIPNENIENILRNAADILYNFEFEGKHKNGTQVPISATITPVLGEKKRISTCLLIGNDITYKVKAEEVLAERYERVQEVYTHMGVLSRQMDCFSELLKFSSSGADRREAANFIVSSLVMLTGINACALRLYNPKKDSLDLVSSFGFAEDWRGKGNLKYKGSLGQKAFEKNTFLRITDVTKEPRYQSPCLARKNNLCSLLLIPLQFNGKILGTLSLYTDPKKKFEVLENRLIEKYAQLSQLVLGVLSF